MMVSTKGRYALRLMIDIAKQGEYGSLITMRDAAEREDLSVKYLEQLGGTLVKAGLLRSVRGVNGGYMLSRPAEEIPVGDILRATEGKCILSSCVADARSCEKSATCEARDFWVGFGQSIAAYVDSVMLSDLVKPKQEGSL